MNGSYQFEKLEGRQIEADFLAERAQLRLEGFKGLLERHGFPTHGKILEAGCGQGIRTKLMAEYFPHAEITGIDRSSELLAEARINSPLNFKEADIYELPFADDSFDFVYSRLVFMHLKDPQLALKNLLRVLKPGGRILIEDADRDCMFFEPAPASFPEFWEKVQTAQRRLGGDPNVGRKLAPYLKKHGLSGINIEAQPITGDGKDISFLARTLMPSLNLYLEPQDREMGHKAIADLHTLATSPEASFYHFWFAVSGAKV